MRHVDQLSATFTALADPTRRAILARLAKGESIVSDLAAPFDMSLPAVTKHLKVLEGAGLITKTRDAQRRLCALNPAGFKATLDYLELYRDMLEQSLDRLEEFLKTTTKSTPATPGKK